MADVQVTAADGGWRVIVRSDGATTEHDVSVPGGMAERLGTDEQRLVEASFSFLLEREPPSSILRQFSLDVIGQYFPDYEKVLPTLI